MVASLRSHRLILPIAPIVAGVAGLVTALFFALAPIALIERLTIASGLAAALPVAAPPLGITARMALILGGGAAVTALLWAALYLLVGTRAFALTFGREVGDDAVPVLRRADAHPDAPARRPLFAARDLGEPIGDAEPASGPDERALPADLDQTLAAYDPDAIRPVPAEPVRPVRPLVRIERPQVFEPGDRLETFALNRPAPPKPRPEATIHALLDRLEQGVARRDQPLPDLYDAVTGHRVDDALGALRRLAAGH